MAVVTVLAGLVVLLTACGPTGGGAQALAPASPSPSASPSAVPSSVPSSTSDTRCTTSDLRAGLVVRPDELGAHRAAVVWTNTSGAACRMEGFGGVDLDGPDQRTFGPVYHLPRSTERPTTVTLAPGGSAQTVLNYLSPDGVSGPDTWVPDHALVTPPDETHSVPLTWPFGPVVRQDAATHPGTFLHPVTPVPDTAAPPCTAADVTAALVAEDAGAGNRYLTLRLSSRGGRRCEVDGPLPLGLLGGQNVIVDQSGAGPSSVVVDGAHAASVLLHWTVASEPQVTPQAITVRLPGTADGITVAWSGGPVDASEQHFSITGGPVTSAP